MNPDSAREERNFVTSSPSPVASRAALLLASVIASGTIAHNLTWFRFGPGRHSDAIRTTICTLHQVANGTQITTANAECSKLPGLTLAQWMLTGVGVLIAVALVLYLTLPLFLERRSAAIAVTSENPLAPKLQKLVDVAGIKPPPEFLTSQKSTTSAAAFGRLGHFRVRLDRGLVAGRAEDPDRFSIVVLHELAHVRNKDAHTHYLTRAAWWSFLGTALLPASAAIAVTDSQTRNAWVWRIAAITLVVTVTTIRLLYSREYYADRWAHTWANDSERQALRRLLGAAEAPSGRRRWRWRHPSPKARLANIDQGGRKADLRPIDILLAGLAAMLLGDGIQAWISDWVTNYSELNARWLALLPSGLLLGVLVASDSCRAAAVGLGRRAKARRCLSWGLFLAVGLMAGYWVSLNSVSQQVVGWGTESWVSWCIITAILATACALLYAWALLCAGIREHARDRIGWWWHGAALIVPLSVIVAWMAEQMSSGPELLAGIPPHWLREQYDANAKPFGLGPYWLFESFHHPWSASFAAWGPAAAAAAVLSLYPAVTALRAGAQPAFGRTPTPLVAPFASAVGLGAAIVLTWAVRGRVTASAPAVRSPAFAYAMQYWSLIAIIVVQAACAIVVFTRRRSARSAAQPAFAAALLSGWLTASLGSVIAANTLGVTECADRLPCKAIFNVSTQSTLAETATVRSVIVIALILAAISLARAVMGGGPGTAARNAAPATLTGWQSLVRVATVCAAAVALVVHSLATMPRMPTAAPPASLAASQAQQACEDYRILGMGPLTGVKRDSRVNDMYLRAIYSYDPVLQTAFDQFSVAFDAGDSAGLTQADNAIADDCAKNYQIAVNGSS